MSTPTNKGRGVLQINAAATRKPAKQAPRLPAPKLRLIIRRLPPGLTEVEFWNTLSTEWHVGQGKIDWAAYQTGKISKDVAKPSKPARAYLKVKDSAFLEPLSQHVRTITFQDAKNSLRDPCLVGPPSLEFAPYNKTPGGRARHDGRQGTIDQDSEFIDFLQSLTEPIVKSTANGEPIEARLEKVTTTPLVQYIKEKKANKAKEKEAAAVSKASKKATETKDAKETKEKSSASSKSESRSTVVKKTATTEAEKARVAKATQDAMTAINRSVAAMKGKPTSEKPESAASAQGPAPAPQSTRKRERRGDASAAARIIGRDLGLTTKEGRSSRASRNVSTPVSAQTPVPVPSSASTITPRPAAVTPSSPQVPQSPSQNSAPAQAPTGPRNLRNATAQQPQQRSGQPPNTPNAPKSAAKSHAQPSAGAKSAFLKHANPSQGVTEELLRTTLSTYGTITRCEIDKKKGLGYVDFTDTEALRKAMAASPVKVGNGSVVVLENKTPYRKVSQVPSRPGTASPAASAASSPKTTNATLASITEQVSSQQAKTVKPPISTDTSAPAPIKANPPECTAPPSEAGPIEPVVTEAPSSTSQSAADPKSPTANQANPSSTPKGNGRNGGRGGQHRGNRGNRARGNFRGNTNRANANARKTSTSTTQESPGQQAGEAVSAASGLSPDVNSGG